MVFDLRHRGDIFYRSLTVKIQNCGHWCGHWERHRWTALLTLGMLVQLRFTYAEAAKLLY